MAIKKPASLQVKLTLFVAAVLKLRREVAYDSTYQAHTEMVYLSTRQLCGAWLVGTWLVVAFLASCSTLCFAPLDGVSQ